MNANNIQDLVIAKNTFRLSKDIKIPLNRDEWINYIERHKDFFIWREETAEGKAKLMKAEKMNDKKKERILKRYNKSVCYADYDDKKGYFNITVGFIEEYKRISISFERNAKQSEIKLFLDMAKNLNALLLYNGDKIIDDKFFSKI